MGAGSDRKPTWIQRMGGVSSRRVAGGASVRATILAKIANFWAAALILAIGLSAGGAALAQSTGGGGGGGGHGATGGHGPTAYANPGACGAGLLLAPPAVFGDAADAVKDMSEATQSYIRNCSCATQACMADALEQYAEALAQVAPRLPPHLQNTAGIVATAAARLRIARNKSEAARAINDAIAAIHKDIELVRAEDPDNPRATRGGEFVADTLNVASLALEKGGGL